MFGVDEQYRGKGVASELVQETINVAKSNGYKKVITESTGTISQGIFDKFGFINWVLFVQYV